MTLNRSTEFGVTRRGLLSGATGLVLAMHIPAGNRAMAKADSQGFTANAFVQVHPGNKITIFSKHSELGQGPFTGLATLIAEEMDADWSTVSVESAPNNREAYKNLFLGLQSTGGSTAIANSYAQMREVGAQVRTMLVAAAAQKWGVDAADIAVANSQIEHETSGRSANFGEFAELAMKQPIPEKVALKKAADFKLIGTDVGRVDTKVKTTGSALYGLDVYLQDMLTAVVARPPKFGATVKSFDAAKTLAVTGVVMVKQVPQGVAVYAENTYAAIKGRRALTVQWDESQAETRSSDEIIKVFREAAQSDGVVAATKGDVANVLQASAPDELVEAEFVFPLLAHAPMEPLNAVMEQRGDKIEVWHGCQAQTTDHMAIARVLGAAPENVKLNSVYAGGSFGRRAQQDAHLAVEAAQLFDASGRKRPVKTMWTREDDIQGGYYRPVVVHRLRGAMKDGVLTAWDQTIAAKSLVRGSPLEFLLKDAPADFSIAEGAMDFYYKTDNHKLSISEVEMSVPVLWWRSVGHTHTAFAVESFIDVLLQQSKQDPVAGRLKLLENRPRDAAVLRRAAEMMDWGRKPRPGAAFGVAVHKSFGTFVAEIVEVSMQQGMPVVHDVWAAVDCGVAVNPDVIKAQIEGGIGYGLGAALFNAVTLQPGGAVQQSNFHDYRPLRISEMPNVHVAIVSSSENPTGVGEPGTPPIAPAVANAVRRLTNQMTTQLPFVKA